MSEASGALELISRLEQSGYEAWIVGGAVRDRLMGGEGHDMDLATNAVPDEIEQVFSDCRTLDVGKSFGTVRVVYREYVYEVTTYRAESDYRDGRHPEQVVFSDRIEDDLKRRDFTINAMAWHPERGLLDLYGGVEDLRSGTLRAVGVASERIGEDALRMLRAIRFSSRFGFELDTALFEAIRGHHAALRHVSAERCYDELERMLCGPSPAQAMLLLHQTMLWDDVFPELQWNAVHGAILETTAPSPAMRWAALGRGNTTVTGDRRPLPILDEFTEEDSRRMGRVLKRLKSSNALQREATALLRMRVEDLPQSREMMQRFMGKHQKLTDAHLAFLSAEVEAAQMEGMDSLRWSRRVMLAGELEEDVIRLKLPVGLQDLAVRGNTLLSWGCAPGEPIGEALCLLLDAVIDGKTENTADALRQYWRMQQKGEK